MRGALRHLIFFAGLVTVAGSGVLTSRVPDPAFTIPLVAHTREDASREPRYEENFLPDSTGAPDVHAASLVETRPGRLLAVWYGGSREGARDVAIYGAAGDEASSVWKSSGTLVNRVQTSLDLGRYVKTLGNPVLARDGDGRIWLFYVSVSVGGWSGSALNYRVSNDEGRTWEGARRLVTSPFLNISTLAKGPPLLFDDGSMGLPVYHEFAGKFGEFLRISPTGRVMDKARVTWGRSSLQPVILPTGKETGVAFLRYAGDPPRRILAAETRDAGSSWGKTRKLGLPNPNAAISAIRTRDGLMIMVYNDLEKDRHDLSLAVSRDQGQTWRKVHTFEFVPEPPPGKRRSEFSYPFMVESSSGNFHLLYTWQKNRVKPVVFNREWLNMALQTKGKGTGFVPSSNAEERNG